jgi:glycosyltransferase involved in cell wall biosynthesis
MMRESKKPLVSVCIPVYNCERFVGGAIESVLNQGFTDFELLILDDCSTDNSPAVIGAFKDTRIRVLRNESNLGLAGNWNKSIAESRGRYCKILPHDDVLYPGCLQRQVEILENPSHCNVSLVSCARDIVDSSGEILLTRNSGMSGVVDGLQAVRTIVRRGTNILGEPAAIMFRKVMAGQCGLFDEQLLYVIDIDYWCRMLDHGDLFVIPEPLCAFRVWSRSTSVCMFERQSYHFTQFAAGIRRKKGPRITFTDILLGAVRSHAYMLLRWAFYWYLYARKKLF